jgi:AcrR family transcriptional regulator
MKIELDATEEKLVSATFGIIRREGFKGATTKKIASEAGVNEVTVFRKFKNKKNLIEITKDYYIQKLLEKLEAAFDFTGDEEIVEYLEKNFNALLDLPDEEFSIIKVAMEEVGEVSEKKHLISRITDTILDKFEAYFKLQIEKGTIRDVDARVLGTLCYSMTFQSIVLLRVYNHVTDIEKENFGKNYIDILFNGIKK